MPSTFKNYICLEYRFAFFHINVISLLMVMWFTKENITRYIQLFVINVLIVPSDRKFEISSLIFKVIIERCRSSFTLYCCDKTLPRTNLEEESIDLWYPSRLSSTTEGSQCENLCKN